MADPNNQSTAIARKASDTPAGRLNAYLSNPKILKNLQEYARNSVNPATMIRLAVFACGQDDWLARCQPETFYASLIVAAQLGLEPSGVRGEAYLVPYKGRVTLIPGYRGLIKLALRSKAVKQIYAHLVYEGDDFVYQLGTDVQLHHKPLINGGPEREVIAAYAVAVLANGEKQVEVMDRAELDRIKAFAAEGRGGKEGPAYAKWGDQMMRKAPVRRLCKFLPLGDDYFIAAKLDELHDEGKPEHIGKFLDVQAEDRGVVDAEHSDEAPQDKAQQISRIQQAADRATGAPPPSGKAAGVWRPRNGGNESTSNGWNLRTEKRDDGVSWVATSPDGELSEGMSTTEDGARKAASEAAK